MKQIQSNGTTLDMDLPRGLRLNNPGNIRISQTKWQGEVIPSADKSFKQFKTLALNTMIDIAERELKVDIRKKAGAKR